MVVRAAVDGQELSAKGGRSRLQKGTWRPSHDEVDVRTRVARHLGTSALSTCGGAEVWPQYGCARSHLAVLERVRRKLHEESFMLVVEDDLALGPGPGVADPQWGCVLQDF